MDHAGLDDLLDGPTISLTEKEMKNCWYQLISQGAGKSALHRVSAHPHQPARGKAIAASP